MTEKCERPFRTEEERTAETARLNDLARTAPHRVNAAWVTTPGVAALIECSPGRALELVQAVAGFSAFGPDNHPTENGTLGRSRSGASVCAGRSTTAVASHQHLAPPA